MRGSRPRSRGWLATVLVVAATLLIPWPSLAQDATPAVSGEATRSLTREEFRAQLQEDLQYTEAATPGGTVRVVEVEDEDAALLTHFAELGLVPGAAVEVLSKGPFGGPLHIRVAGREHALGELVAGAVLITTDQPAS